MRSAIACLLAGAIVLESNAAHAQSNNQGTGAHAAPPATHWTHSHAAGGADAGDAHDPIVASLIERVREATAHLRDPRAAARAGYRRMGTDFPAMGEHWVNPGLLLRRELDFGAPAILTYTTIDGRATLTGVVLTMGLSPGEAPPHVAGAERPWHEHNGSIADESFVRPAPRPVQSDRRRLAVLHLWTEVPNPAGPFATENWALPFARLGFTAPDPVPPGAARTLSLVAGGDSYFADLIHAASGPAALAASRPFIVEARAKTLLALKDGRRHESLSTEALATLESIWTRMVARLAAACGDCAGALAER